MHTVSVTRYDGTDERNSRRRTGNQTALCDCFVCGKELTYPFVRIVTRDIGTVFEHEACYEKTGAPKRPPPRVAGPKPV